MRRCLAGLLAGAMLIGAAPALEGPMEIYLLMGQSNMSGRGELAQLTDAERAVDPAILLYGNDGKWRAAADPLDDPLRQIDEVSSDKGIAAVGPGLFFARALPRKKGVRIGLVPCAKGGSKIAAWKPGTARDTLYGSCLARAKEAAGRGRIAGMLWYQGESATGAKDQAESWAPDFTAMVAAFRRDLGRSSLPLVFVGLADRPPRENTQETFPYWEYVQGEQAGLKLPCAATVSAAGLALKADAIHLTTTAQRRLGPELAVAMTGLRRSGKCG